MLPARRGRPARRGPPAPTGPVGPATGQFFSAQIIVTPTIVAAGVQANQFTSPGFVSSPTVSGDPTFGGAVPNGPLYVGVSLPQACTFDSIAVSSVPGAVKSTENSR